METLRERKEILGNHPAKLDYDYCTLLAGKVRSGDIIVGDGKVLLVDKISYRKATKRFTFHCDEITLEYKPYLPKHKFKIDSRRSIRVLVILYGVTK